MFSFQYRFLEKQRSDIPSYSFGPLLEQNEFRRRRHVFVSFTLLSSSSVSSTIDLTSIIRITRT